MKLNAKQFGMPPRYWNASLTTLTIPAEYHKAIVDWLKDPKYILILSGSPGTGKTHLCAAILNDFWQGKEVRFFREDDLFSEAIEAVNRNWNSFRQVLDKCNSKHLIIDDFGIDELTSYRLNLTERLIDFRYSKADKAATIITTNLNALQIRQKYSERIASRLFAEENKLLILEGYNLRGSTL